MLSILIKSPSQPPLMPAASCQLLRKLGYRPTISILENNWIYKFLGGVFCGNTQEKCPGVYTGIPMVYFGCYMYQQYVYSVVI